jgi:flavorubredoxin
MLGAKMSDRITWVGVVDWDRRLFDALIPTPEGTSYNSWLVRGKEKTALVDTVDPAFTTQFLEHLDGEAVTGIDYVVANHAEQDHSGSIQAILDRFPEAVVLCTDKCKGLLMDLLHVSPARIRAVADGETVPLGGLTLNFVHFPWVHWPETMVTWIPEEKVLLSCDLFGSHLAQSGFFMHDSVAMLSGAKRYFAEIMLPFRAIIEKNLPKLAALKPQAIGPSHGPAHLEPALIMEAYAKWVSPEPKNLVALAYVSMHDSTKIMVRYLVNALSMRGVRVEQFDLTDGDIGRLAMSLVDAATLVIGTPTVLGGAHPKAAFAAFLVNALRPKAKNISIIGSYAWGGKTVEQLTGMMPNIKAEVIPPVMVKGKPREQDKVSLTNLADEILKRHKGLGD